MKKNIYIATLFLIGLLLSGCNNKYQGYWCRYEETSTIVVLLNKDNTKAQRTKIEETISNFESVESQNFYSREDYANELGENIENLDIYDTYVIVFDSMDSIGTYIEDLKKLDGVKEATQNNAKTNISLYNIQKGNKYTYSNSDEASEEDLETGTYKIKKGVITFTPDNNNSKTKLLYIKNGHLCADADCNEIFAESNENCSSNSK